MLFLYLFDSPESPPRRPPSLFGRQSCLPRISFRHLQVRLDLSFQLQIQPAAPHQRQDTFDSSTPPHGAASRNRATSALACSHFWTSASSCLVPALVNE